MRIEEPVAKRGFPAMVILIVAAALLAAAPAALGAASAAGEAVETEHCVAVASEEAADGRLVLSEPECYPTVAEAAAATKEAGAALTDALRTAAQSAVGADATDDVISSITLGIHYDGSSGSGSSISIVGSGCTGGYWNALGWWKNRISSSYNGCYRLKHFDFQNRSGAMFTTLGSGTTDNLSWFANMTESVSYHSS